MPPRILRLGHRAILVAALAALVVVLVGASSSAAWALWSASTTTSSSVAVGSVSATITGTSALTATFSSSVGSVTAPVTFSNTGSLPGTYSAVTTLTSGSNAALAARIGVIAWPVADLSACTSSAPVGPSSVTGTWSALPSLTGSLAAGSSTVWCIRSTLSSTAPASTPSAAAATQPIIALTLTDGDWTSASVVGTFTESTAASVPALQCTAFAGNLLLLLSWSTSGRPLTTSYGVFVNGTMVGQPVQGFIGQTDLIGSQVPASIAPDGVARVDVTVLDSAMKPTTTIAATGTVTFFPSLGFRGVKCGG